MKLLIIKRIIIGNFTLLFLQCQAFKDPDVGKTPIEIITSHGYPAETHNVTTKDGYILTVFRIPHGKGEMNRNSRGPPVLLIHGLLSSAADYVNTDERSLGFMVADSGYDLWLINLRGNFFSKRHIRLDEKTQKAQFYNYSLDEVARFDAPDTIDYILSSTSQEQLYFIGDSEGCSVFSMLLSGKPTYNKKIRFASLMGPSISFYHAHLRLKIIAPFWPLIEKLTALLRIYRFPGILGTFIRTFGPYVCSLPLLDVLCALPIGYKDMGQINYEKMRTIVTIDPTDTSIKLLLHYLQIILRGHEAYYDYGKINNVKLYGSPEPPDYNLSKVTAPVALYYAKNDLFVTLKDARETARELQNVVVKFEIPYEKFTHFDFIFGKDTYKRVYDHMIQNIKLY